MLLLFIGPSCSGKSSVAEIIGNKTGAKVWSGKNYLRLAKNEDSAWSTFKEMLEHAMTTPELGKNSIIYVVTDFKQLKDGFISKNRDKITTVKFASDIEILKERFSKRIRQKVVPPPIAKMLENQLQSAQNEKGTFELDSSKENSEQLASQLMSNLT